MSGSRKSIGRSHPAVFLAAVAVAGIIIYPFITPLILSVITAYVFRPVVKRLEVHMRSYHLALGILVVLIGLPVIFVVWYISANAAQFFGDIAGLGDEIKAVISIISDTIAGMGLGTYAQYFLGAQDITERITSYAVSIASDFVRSIPILLLDIVIYLYATYYFMRDGHKIVEFIKSYASTLPAEDEHFLSSILSGLKRSFDVLFLSYITMSVIIGVASFAIYYIFGAPYALLLAILTGLFGFLPILGTWMVYIPVAAYMYYIGNTFAAVGILIFGVVILTLFIPFVLQPYLGAKKAEVSPITILLGFFSGPIIFGVKGLLLGPIIFVVAETVIVEYMRYRISEGTQNS